MPQLPIIFTLCLCALAFRPLSSVYAGRPCWARRLLICDSNRSTTELFAGGVVLVGVGLLGFGFDDDLDAEGDGLPLGEVEGVADGLA